MSSWEVGVLLAVAIGAILGGRFGYRSIGSRPVVGMVVGASLGAVLCGGGAFFSDDIKHFFQWLAPLLRFHFT